MAKSEYRPPPREPSPGHRGEPERNLTPGQRQLVDEINQRRVGFNPEPRPRWGLAIAIGATVLLIVGSVLVRGLFAP